MQQALFNIIVTMEHLKVTAKFSIVIIRKSINIIGSVFNLLLSPEKCRMRRHIIVYHICFLVTTHL